MTAPREVAAGEDPALRGLAASFAPVCTLVGKTWGLHLEKVVKVDRDENLRMIERVGRLPARRGQDRDLRRRALLRRLARRPRLRAALRCRPRPRRAPPTCRCATPTARRCPTASRPPPPRWSPQLGCEVGIHCHDDCGLGVANSLAGVRAGATMVQGTMNGYGERCGNANLVLDRPEPPAQDGPRRACPSLTGLTEAAHFLDELSNFVPDPDQPYVGENAFAHKGGLHVAGVNADPATSSTSTRPRSATRARC